MSSRRSFLKGLAAIAPAAVVAKVASKTEAAEPVDTGIVEGNPRDKLVVLPPVEEPVFRRFNTLEAQTEYLQELFGDDEWEFQEWNEWKKPTTMNIFANEVATVLHADGQGYFFLSPESLIESSSVRIIINQEHHGKVLSWHWRKTIA